MSGLPAAEVQRLDAGGTLDEAVDDAVELLAAGVVDAAGIPVEAEVAGAAGIAVVLCEGYGVGNSPAGGISPLLGELQPAKVAIASMAPRRYVTFMIALQSG